MISTTPPTTTPTASQPRRCYASRPVAVDHTPTTLAYGSLFCVSGNRTIEAKVVNDTIFCCVVNSGANASANSTQQQQQEQQQQQQQQQQQKLFVWPASIEVRDANALWFTDTAGIVSPTTTSAPSPTGDVSKFYNQCAQHHHDHYYFPCQW